MEKMPYPVSLDVQTVTRPIEREPAPGAGRLAQRPAGARRRARDAARAARVRRAVAVLDAVDRRSAVASSRRRRPDVARVRALHPVGARERAAGRYACFAVVPPGYDVAVGIFQVRQLDPAFTTGEWGACLGSQFWGTGVFDGRRPPVDGLRLRRRRVASSRSARRGPERTRQRRHAQARRRPGRRAPPVVVVPGAVPRPDAVVDPRGRLAPVADRAAPASSLEKTGASPGGGARRLPPPFVSRLACRASTAFPTSRLPSSARPSSPRAACRCTLSPWTSRLFDFDLPAGTDRAAAGRRPRGRAPARARPRVRAVVAAHATVRALPQFLRPVRSPRREQHARCSRHACSAAATRAAARSSACWSGASTATAGRR